MATIFGFKTPVFTQTNSSVKLRRIAENYIKTNTDEFGQVSDPQVYQEAINLLLPYGDDILVANKIADYKNAALKLSKKVEDAENSVVLFKDDFEKGRAEIIGDSYGDSLNFFESLYMYYGKRLDFFDDKIYSKVIEGSPRGQNVSSSVLNYRNDLNTKLFNLGNLVNSNLIPDPETGVFGPSNPDAWGTFITTNPQTGAIVDIDVKPVVSTEDFPKGFSRTDSRYGRTRLYLNTFSSGEDRQAKLGEMNYKWDQPVGEEGKLSRQKGFLGEIKELFAIGVAQEKAEEVSLKDIPFDSFQIPVDNVVKDTRGNYYYYGSDGNLSKFENLNMAKQYLSQIGKNPKDAEEKVFQGHPDFIKAKFTLKEDGAQRLINSETMGTAVGSATAASFVPSAEQQARAAELKGGRVTGSSVRVQPSREFGGEQYDPRKILEKGRELFRPVTQPFENIFRR